MKTSTGGKLLVALAFASMISGLFIGTALGEDNGWRKGQQNRGWHERDHGGWRDKHGRWHAYQPVYVPPPVVYAPPPSPRVSIFFPFPLLFIQ